MVRTNQGGSILGFVVIGGVMVLLLIGGVYFVRHNLMPATDRDPVAVQDDSSNKTPSSEEEPSASEGDNQDESKKDDDGPADVGVFTPSQVTPNKPQSQTESNNGSTDNLPETGLSSTVLTSLLLSGAVGVAVAYKRSRGSSVSL